MREYLVEVYMPRKGAADVREAAVRARETAVQLSGEGIAVRYVRAIFVPEDETCFYVLEATSTHHAADAIRRAGVSPQRVTEAVRADADREDEQ
jgi:hypothetical protein